MLVLTRRLNDRLYIGSDVVIEVLSISRTKVRLGIKAPREVSVVREEAIEQEAKNRKDVE